jgi:hypothetical protein
MECVGRWTTDARYESPGIGRFMFLEQQTAEQHAAADTRTRQASAPRRARDDDALETSDPRRAGGMGAVVIRLKRKVGEKGTRRIPARTIARVLVPVSHRDRSLDRPRRR